MCHHDPQNLDIETLRNELIILKADIKDAICELKLKRCHKLRNKTLRKDAMRKKFWRILKTQIEEAILYFSKIFCGQRHPVFDGPPAHDQLSLCA